MNFREARTKKAFSRRPVAVAALLSLFVFALSSNALPAVLLRAAEELSVSGGLLAQVSAVQFCGYLLAAISGGLFAALLGCAFFRGDSTPLWD